jgi:hypothetical protein
LKTLTGSCGHLIASYAAPINHKAGVKPQLSDEFSLTATVTFSERVRGIDFA